MFVTCLDCDRRWSHRNGPAVCGDCHEAAGHRCQRCGNNGPLEVHHIAHGDPGSPLAVLCAVCHHKHHNEHRTDEGGHTKVQKMDGTLPFNPSDFTQETSDFTQETPVSDSEPDENENDSH